MRHNPDRLTRHLLDKYYPGWESFSDADYNYVVDRCAFAAKAIVTYLAETMDCYYWNNR